MKGFGDHPVVCLVELQVECGRFDRLLLIAGQPCEAVGEGIGYAEVHSADYRLNVGIARIMKSSKRGTVKSRSPCAGL